MALPKSAANLPLRLWEVEMPCRIMRTFTPFKASPTKLHGTCPNGAKTEITHQQTCLKCGGEVIDPAKGSKVPPAPKIFYCPNEECGHWLANQIIQEPFCPNCQRRLDPEWHPETDAILSGFRLPDGRVVVISQEELEAVNGLAPNREIKVVGALENFRLPRLIHVDTVYQLLPEEQGNLLFAVLAAALKRGRVSLLVELKLKQYADDHRALITHDEEDERVWLITLHRGCDLVHHQTQPVLNLPEAVVQTMSRLIRSSIVNPAEEVFETAASQAFRQLLEAKVSGGEVVRPQHPANPEQVAALIAQLRQSMIELTKAMTEKTAEMLPQKPT